MSSNLVLHACSMNSFNLKINSQLKNKKERVGGSWGSWGSESLPRENKGDMKTCSTKAVSYSGRPGHVFLSAKREKPNRIKM